MSTSETHSYEVPEELAGERVDVAAARLADLSRGAVRRAIDSELLLLNGESPKPSDRVATADQITVRITRGPDRIEADPTVPFDVLYEDADLLVVDKPAGVVVHSGTATEKPTLVNGLVARFPDIRGVGQEGRWGIVHRLDRDTSGLLVVARSNESYAALVEMIRQRSVTRRYLTVVQGVFANTTGTIDAPIARDPRNRTRMVVQQEGRSAVTHYRRLAVWEARNRSMLSVKLETGRTHQIRVHMQAIDHPIIGDPAYGRSGGEGDPVRPWLHARQLVFAHPTTGAIVDVTSPVPRDLSDSLGSFGEPDIGTLADEDGADL